MLAAFAEIDELSGAERKKTARRPCRVRRAVGREPVSRVLCAGPKSGRRSFLSERGRPRPLAAYPQRLCRGGHLSLLIWPCSRWGLPCRGRCRPRGGLLLHRFTLARSSSFPDAVGGLLSVALSVVSPAETGDAQSLSGSAPNGARTFLERRQNDTARDHPVGDLLQT